MFRAAVPALLLGLVLSAASSVAKAQATPQSEPTPPEPPSSPEKKAPSTAPLEPVAVLEQVAAIYPQEAQKEGASGVVVVVASLREDGSVSHVSVGRGVHPALDAAAAAAVSQWRFSPSASGQPLRHVAIPVRFDPLPAASPAEESPQEESPTPADEAPVEPTAKEPELSAEDQALLDQAMEEAEGETIHITGHGGRTETRSSADFELGHDELHAAPRAEGAEVLRSAPGLYIGRSGGLAVAHKYTLRGFDAEHGQDIDLRVGGLPINLPSHIHGQGYADLGFLIGETVHTLQVSEGVYDPNQGDFAVAGSIHVDLAMPQRGVLTKTSMGRFGTSRVLAAWSPEGTDEHTFGAVQHTSTQGFGENRAGQATSAIAQATHHRDKWSYRVLAIAYAARASMAGLLRRDDIDAGEVGFYDVYDLPTARQQNAATTRAMLGLFSEYRMDDGGHGEISVWASSDDFRIQHNFTGFLQRSRSLENVTGRGDLIEQMNNTTTLGVGAHYNTKTFRSSALSAWFEFGFSGRLDDIDQKQNLIDAAVRNQTWDQRVDASITGTDLGLWSEVDTTLGDNIANLRLGFRADALHYSVDDRLGNFAPSTRPDDDFIVGFRRSSAGLAWGPRSSLEVPLPGNVSVVAAYGQGYRSPQARTLEDGETAPFTTVRSADVGARIHRDSWSAALSGYYTHLGDDVAFEAREGRLERVGASQRLGVVAFAQARPLSWLLGSLSLTYVDATLLEPPPATADDPQPPFELGQNLPFIPPLVVRADMAARHGLGVDVLGEELEARVGLGFNYLSPRPLPFGDFAEPVGLLDVSAELRTGDLALSFDLFNALNRQYGAVEYSHPSNWDPQSPPSRLPARHLAAGSPLAWMTTLELTL